MLREGVSKGPLDGLSRSASATIYNMAAQDHIMVAFHTFMWLRVTLAPDGTQAMLARSATLGLVVATVVVLWLTRGEIIASERARAVIYRIGMFVPMVGSYFTLKWLLPALQPQLLDPQLLAIDRALFGATPSKLMEPWVSMFSVEWFSFFYYSYFYLLGAYMLGSLVFDRGRRLYEVMFGALVVVTVGHVSYTLVPGLGPYAENVRFARELEGGFWWAQVTEAVSAAGAMLDIFPSLHTAFPSFFALHAWRYRHEPPYTWAWFPTAFFAVNTVLATMFLRWHYGIDVVAGLTLAYLAHRLAVASADREAGRHHHTDKQAVWEPLRNATT